MSRVVITGCDGQDGQILSRKLADLGYEVFGITHRNQNYVSPAQLTQQRLIIDYSDPKLCWKSLDSIQPSHIFHFAGVHAGSFAMNDKTQSSSTEMHNTHVLATRNILEWQKSNQCSSHFPLSAKMFTVGGSNTPINESTPVSPTNFYGETKAACWELIRRYRESHQVPANGYILFPHYSRYSKPGFFAYDWAERICNLYLRKSPQEIHVTADSLVDISHAIDICNAVVECATKGIVGDLVLGYGELLKISTIIKEVLVRFELYSGALFEFCEVHSPALISDISKARRIVGWTPSLAPHESIYEICLDMLN